MTTFDDRETAYEKKFANDGERTFKLNARTTKLLGLWAAQKAGKTGEAAEAYAKELVVADLEEAGIEDVIRKLIKDFGLERAEIEAARAQCHAEALKQLA